MAASVVEIRLASALTDEPGELELEALRHPDSGAIIYPTRALASWRAVCLLRRGHVPGMFGAFFCEFSGFAREILARNGVDPILLDDGARRLITRQGLEKALETLGDLSEIRIQEAALPGLAAHLLNVMTALKQAGIPPETFEARVAAASQVTPVDRLVLDVYRRYQEELVRSGTCDIPGLYWLAEELIRTRGRDVLGGLRYLYLDGFEDFTPSQIRLLKELSSHLDGMVIRIHYDPDPGRDRDFLLQRRCLDALRNIETPAVRIQVIEEPHAQPRSQSQWLAEWFANRKPMNEAAEAPRMAGLRQNVRLLPCVDVYDEADRIARDIRRQVREQGGDLATVAVAVPDIRDCGWIFERAFARQELPCTCLFSRGLGGSLAGSFLLLLTRLMEGLDAVLALELAEHPLAGPEDLLAPELIRGQLPEMCRRLLPRALCRHPEEILEQRLAEMSHSGDAPGQWEQPARYFIAWCQWLRQVRGMFPESSDIRRIIVGIEEVLQVMAVPARLAAQAAEMDAEAAEAELAAWETLQETLASMYDAADPDREVAGKVFADQLRRAIQETDWPGRSGQPGVLLGGIDLMRRPGVRRLYLGGMNEGLFPAATPAGVVYSAESLVRLGEALGVTLEGPRERALRQAMLFLGVLERDLEGVVLSWRLQGPDGSEMFVGSFLEEIRFLAGKVHQDLGGSEVPIPGELPREMEPLPNVFHDAMTRAAVEEGEEAELLWQRAAELAGPERASLLRAVRDGIAVERRRHDRKTPFDQYDGMLRGEDTRTWIASRFDERHVFRVTRLEQYLLCPFTFFVTEVLGIDELDVPPGGLEMSALVRGSLVHGVLEWVFSDPTRYRGPASAEELLEVYRQHAGRYRKHLANLLPGVLEHELRHLAQITACFLRLHLEKCEDQPVDTFGAGLEISFGRRGRNGRTNDQDPGCLFPEFHAVPETLDLKLEGPVIRIAGQIDRIDVLDHESRRCRIIDYKTGQLPVSKQIREGVDVQLMLYARAVKELFKWECDAAWYVSVSQPDKIIRLPDCLRLRSRNDPTHAMAASELWELGMKRTLESVARAVSRLRSGCFPPVTWDGLAQACVPSGRYQTFRVREKAVLSGWAQPDEEETADTEGEGEA